jgi:CheY-like chemotaxis protein
MNGLEATRQIRRLEEASTLTYSVPIVAVSGNARPEWAERARDAGMDGFIRKPYGKAELEAVVGSWRRRGRTVSY